MVTILNHYGPGSEDAWLASLLMQALKDLLPGMFGAELGFLVILSCICWDFLRFSTMVLKCFARAAARFPQKEARCRCKVQNCLPAANDKAKTHCVSFRRVSCFYCKDFGEPDFAFNF